VREAADVDGSPPPVYLLAALGAGPHPESMVPDRDRADARKILIRLLPDPHRRLRIAVASWT